MELDEMLDRNAVIIWANIWPFVNRPLLISILKPCHVFIILTKRFRYQLNHMSSAFGLIVGDISEAQLMER